MVYLKAPMTYHVSILINADSVSPGPTGPGSGTDTDHCTNALDLKVARRSHPSIFTRIVLWQSVYCSLVYSQ